MNNEGVFEELRERLRNEKLCDLIMNADEAAKIVNDGMVVGLSGFTPSGYPKAVPLAVAERAKRGEKIKLTVYSGASLGPEVDGAWSEAGIIERRLPYQTNSTLRNNINKGVVNYIDMHLSHSTQFLNYGTIPKVDVAIVEALAITENGDIIPTSGIGNSPSFIKSADKVIVEINLSKPMEMEGMADIYITENPPHRKPIEINHPKDRIGTTYIPCGLDKIAGIVITNMQDKTRPLGIVDEASKKISNNIIAFLKEEVKSGRLSKNLLPLQSGVGSVANAVLYGLCESEFENLTCYTEVVQDSMLDLIRMGKVTMASTTSVSPSPEGLIKFEEDIDLFKDKIILRPQEISNNPEIARRIGVIAMNTAIEVDIYGNVNSTHIMGSKMMNGIGGSGDFARNGAITIFSTESIAKNGDISSIVPMVSHVDHTEHDVMVIVTEQGYADLRGLAPRERAIKIIENCAHPDYKEQLRDYLNRACQNGAKQTPHILDEALSWHSKFMNTGTMKKSETFKSAL
ncbi:succinate CoA transferase [Clostridioides difficile]|uniref:acetyl-CoA hydrolase/transferase family protein n=1 Tax=unclassified Clostridioides TaxID=2635829 RepID=UPI0006BBD9F6|nr:acetyl-CoA hydrolase [Clostridioides difficile]MCI9974822.1 acetyl-CoA hydrolase/transferase family protein [Clostridioides difficile]MDB3083327.1 succinate CoA transferase [Clostridioides difficile]MDI7818146.1 acetyl-CoA hydrolase/transferase family protein [Clostridioides difficile]NJI79968.1 acetyl-CoA hydrolase/transferase family protein [Clostridioides difficile]